MVTSNNEELSQRSTLWVFFLAHLTRLPMSLILTKHCVPEVCTPKVYLYRLFALSRLLILGYQLRKMAMLDVGEYDKWDVKSSIIIGSMFLAFLTKVPGTQAWLENLIRIWMFAFWAETFAFVPVLQFSLVLPRVPIRGCAQTYAVEHFSAATRNLLDCVIEYCGIKQRDDLLDRRTWPGRGC